MTDNTIPRRTLGKSGLDISIVGFGLWAAGGDEWGEIDDRGILDAIDYALDAGVNFFDTADVYGMGHSEELLGRAMQGRRDQFVVATKIGWRGFDDERGRSAYDTVDKFIAGVEGNLRRLQIETIDLLQSHIDFREPNLDIFLEGFQRLQQQGKIRAYGVSTSDFDYLRAFNRDGGCASLQIDYSILNRTAEEEILPYCQEHNIGVIVRGPLAMGILTGKYDADTRFEEGDFRRRWHENPDEYEIFLDDLAKVDRLQAVVGDGQSLTQFALRFTVAHPAITTVIPGIKNTRQARENFAVGTMPLLDEETLAEVDAITPEGGGRKIWPA
ncbi:MAG: aldo/keto reductase [Candidatus Promineifilaceae bacterium]|nr:aldo/keto reductase [Candidatus Promineifilaceae bacterium]